MKQTLSSTFIRPRYGSFCFADIPQTIKHLLTGVEPSALSPDVFGALPQTYETVILFFIDSFGWHFFEKYADHYPFLKKIGNEGVVSRLTAQFPSTTTAHVTCIHTGLAVSQSGLCEWQYYEPQLDALITPLLFSFAGTTKRDTLQPTGIAPKKLFPTHTIYQDLKRCGVSTHVFQPIEYARSVYSEAVLRGSNIAPYKTLPEALINLTLLLEQQNRSSYYFLYFDKLDAICHKYGPNSPQAEAEIDALFTVLDRLFFQKLAGKLSNTLFMMIADHGHLEVDPKATIYLNQESRFSEIQRYFKTNRAGELIVPGGSGRDMFIYFKDDLLTEGQAFLAKRLTGQAEVHQTQSLIDQGLFGPTPPSSTFLSRIGNVIILPLENKVVWWYEKGKFEQNYYGLHGGLSRQEMEIPLLLYNFSN